MSIQAFLETAKEEYGPVKTRTLTRDDGRNLKFTGWKLGTGTHGSGGSSGYDCDHTRGVKVWVYVTVGGAVIVRTSRWSRWAGEGSQDTAEVLPGFPSWEEVYEVLCDGREHLPQASKEAWDEASPWLFPEEQEEVVA